MYRVTRPTRAEELCRVIFSFAVVAGSDAVGRCTIAGAVAVVLATAPTACCAGDLHFNFLVFTCSI